MKIMLEMLGAMRKPLGQGPVEVGLPEGATVASFMTGTLGYAPEHVEFLSYFIDGAPAKPSSPLRDGCALKILMIIGGG